MGWLIFALITAGVLVLLALPYPRFQREIQAKRAQLLADSEIFNSSQGALEYAVQGDGPPVLVIHGAGGGYDQGLWLGRLLFGGNCRFVAVSRFGYLRSPIPADATIEHQAAQYAELLDHLGIREPIVAGISAGGPSATRFANDYPDRCRALLLVSAVSQGPQPGDKAPFYVGIIHLLQQSDYAYWLVTKYGRAQMLSLVGIPPQVYAGFTADEQQLAQEMLDTMHPITTRYAGTMNDEAMIRRESVPVGTITAPTLVIHARDDALVSYEHALHAADVIPGAELLSYDAGGHGLLPEIKSVRSAISDFLGQSGQPDSPAAPAE